VDHKPQVRSDHPILRVEIAALDALGELDLLCSGEQRILGGLLEEELQRLEIAGQLFLLRLRGRVVQALDLSALRLPTTDTASESVLLLSVAVRLYPFPSLISGSFMRHESHKALLMVRPVERAVVTRAPHLCHNSQNCGDWPQTELRVAEVTRINPLSSGCCVVNMLQISPGECK
jgi:hypothetical protein